MKNAYEIELWSNITGYEGAYQVSNLGRVKSVKRVVIKEGRDKCVRERILKPQSGGFKGQYLAVFLYREGKAKMHLIHRLVGFYFVPNPDNKPEINHIGENETGLIDKHDNRAVSLAWATAKENIQHAWDNGLMENTRSAAVVFTKANKSKLTINLLTGIFYDSLKEASETSCFSYANLKRMIRIGKNRSPFVYV